MNEETKDLDPKQADEQETDAPNEEQDATQDSETQEGAETEGSETQDSEKSESQEGQEASKSQGNKRAAQHRISKRMKKLKGELSETRAGNDSLQSQLAIANQQIEIMKLANEKKGNSQLPVEPSPDDFDEGVHDPKYIKQFQTYLKAQNQEQIQKEIATQTKSFQQNVSNENLQREEERKQRDHYRRALKMPDYEEKEDALQEILGADAVKDIIANFDDSENIIHNLGDNEDLAYEVADAIESKNNVLAVRLLDRASRAGAKVKPKKEPTPNPDEELPGGSPAATGFEAKRLKMLEKATKMNDQSIYSDFMDKHREEKKKEMAKHAVW